MMPKKLEEYKSYDKPPSVPSSTTSRDPALKEAPQQRPVAKPSCPLPKPPRPSPASTCKPRDHPQPSSKLQDHLPAQLTPGASRGDHPSGPTNSKASALFTVDFDDDEEEQSDDEEEADSDEEPSEEPFEDTRLGN